MLITNSSSIPLISSTLPSIVQVNITRVGIITTGTWNGRTINVEYGGTGLTSIVPYGVLCGGITDTGTLQNAGTGSAGQFLVSTGISSLPTWQTILTDTGSLKFNFLLGSTSGNSITTGSYNYAFGYETLNNLTTGDRNIAIGYQALFYNETASDNLAIGYLALNTKANNIGQIERNIAIGNQALRSNFNGSDNVAIGHLALWNNRSGSKCTAIGSGASSISQNDSNNTIIGAASFNVSTGNNNTMLGANTANNIQNYTYNSCTFLGYSADATNNNLTNAIAIGANSKVSRNNTCVIGIEGGFTLNIGGDGSGNIEAVWNGSVIDVEYGGTGFSSTTPYGVICAGNTDTGALQNIGPGTAGKILTSNGPGALPSWNDSSTASSDATYILQNSDTSLPNAQILSSLSTGLLKNITLTGVLDIAIAGTDYYALVFQQLLKKSLQIKAYI